MEKIKFETILNALKQEVENCQLKINTMSLGIKGETTPLFDNLVELMFKYLPKNKVGAGCLSKVADDTTLRAIIDIDRVAYEMLNCEDSSFYIRKLTQRYSNEMSEYILKSLIDFIKAESTPDEFYDVYTSLNLYNQKVFKSDMTNSIVDGRKYDLSIKFCSFIDSLIENVDEDVDVQKISDMILNFNNSELSLDFIEIFGCENETFNKHARKIKNIDKSKRTLVTLLLQYPECELYKELYESLFGGELTYENIRFIKNLSEEQEIDVDRHSQFIAGGNNPRLSVFFIETRDGYDLKLHGDIIMNGVDEDSKFLFKQSAYYPKYYMQKILEKIDKDPNTEIEIEA